MSMEKRRFIRKPYSEGINYTLRAPEGELFKGLDLSGIGLDISLGGVSLLTDYPVESGHVMKFNSGLEQGIGIVKWSRDSVYNFYSAGVQFF